ncbi:MAG: hypothetical protein HUU25_12440 [Candidatus Sumerlaeia bacterium]|nr:hypothetical protein [Candidatus Sumerlaeia bacterium]
MTRRLLPALLVPALVVMVAGHAAVRGHIPWFMDIVGQFYPFRHLAAQQLHAGVIPLWNPSTNAGVPLLANPQWGVLSPLNWPFFAWPGGATFMLSFLLAHVILCGGGYWLAQAVFASRVAALATSLAMAFGGWTWAHYPFGAYLAAVCWAPWILGTLERHARAPHPRWLPVVAALWALQIVAGAPQAVFYCSLAYGVVALLLGRRPLLLLAGALPLALLISAAQWLPMAELLSNTVRQGGLSIGEVTQGTLNLVHTPSIWRAFTGGNLLIAWQGEDAESTVFIGLAGLALLTLGLAPHALAGQPAAALPLRYLTLLLLALLWCWRPLGPWLYPWLPGYASFHDPKRVLIIAHLASAVLIGRGTLVVERWGGRLGRQPAVTATLGLAVLLAGALLFAVRFRSEVTWLLRGQSDLLRGHFEPLRRAFMASEPEVSLRVFLPLLPLPVLGWLFLHLRERAGALLACVALTAAAGEWLAFASWRIDTKTIAAGFLSPPPPMASLLASLRQSTPAERFAAVDGRIEYTYHYARRHWPWHLLPNGAAIAGVLDAQSFDPAIPVRARRYFDLLNAGRAHLYPRQFTLVRNSLSPLVDLLAVRWIVGPAPGVEYPEISELPLDAGALGERYGERSISGVPREGAGPAVRLFENRRVQSRLVHRSRFVTVAGLDQAQAAIRTLGDDIRECAVLELPGLRPGEYRVPGPASFEFSAVDDAPNHFAATVNGGPGWVILRDQILPGWRAFIDDVEVPIVPADILFRAVEWPGGRHRLAFVYRPATFRLGWSLTCAGLVLLLIGLVAVPAKATRPEHAPASGESWDREDGVRPAAAPPAP